MADNRVAEIIVALCVLYTLPFLHYIYTGISGAGINYGTGRHVQDIPKENLPKALMFWWLDELLYTLTTVLLRLSIAVFLLRICVKKTHKNLIYGTMTVVIVYSIFYLFLAVFQCQPVSYFWNQYAGEQGHCINKSIFPDATFAHSAVSATADFVLGILPVCIIWDLKMNVRTKVSVGVVLSLGVIAGLGTLIRIPYIRVLAITDDFLYATVDVAIWSTVEPALGIIAASACVLRPLFKKFYDLSSRGTYPSQRNTQASTWRRSRTLGRSVAKEEGLELGNALQTANKMAESVITSAGHMTSMSNHVSVHGRDKKGVTFLNKSISSNSSQEELTPARRGGIQVQKTVEVVRTHRRDDDNESRSSTNSNPPMPWPKP